ncbi:MAG TPA: hypothetical protein VHV79_11630 [Mycobacteriales bacterium]|jgi:hypothetical protein|nr:hypothetical protein [Mycobacteriales bacterium]
MSELRVMTLSVGSSGAGIEALGEFVRSCVPDVLLVQAAPQFLRWRSKRAAIARVCGLVVATADRPGGLCVMTALRVDVVDTSFSLLTKESRRLESAISAATVRSGGVMSRVASMQLGADAGERRLQLPALVSALSAGSTVPLVVGGILNEGPGQPVFDEVAERWPCCLAAPATGPALFADRSLSVVSCEAVGGGAGGQPQGVLAVLGLA